MLTEKEAWGVLADKIMAMATSKDLIGSRYICDRINRLCSDKVISYQTRDNMINVIRDNLKSNQDIGLLVPRGLTRVFLPDEGELGKVLGCRADFCDLMYYACEEV